MLSSFAASTSAQPQKQTQNTAKSKVNIVARQAISQVKVKVKVHTVTKTVVRPAPPIASKPRIPPRPSTSASASVSRKRPASPPSRKPPAKKVRAAPERKTGQAKRRAVSDDSSEADSASGTGDDEDGGEGTTPVPSSLKGPEERDIEALEDGRVGDRIVSSEKLVKGHMSGYSHYFLDPADPDRFVADWAGTDPPTVRLEYPGDGAVENFILLIPKDEDDYNPIEDIYTTIETVLNFFVPTTESAALLNHVSTATPAHDLFLTPQVSTPSRASPSLPLPTAPSTPSASLSTTALTTSTSTEPLLRTLQRARVLKDGPTFLSAVQRYNNAMAHWKTTGVISAHVKSLRNIPQKVWEKIFRQGYERTVGPKVDLLGKVKAFSDNVYGELLPRFVKDIVARTGITQGSKVVDLGSGVGNCLAQISLQTGCTTHGFEIEPVAASAAKEQLVEAPLRWRMWRLRGGEMTAHKADFTTDPRIGPVLREADVIICNNFVFTPPTNDALSLLFLELRDGAQIVSLKPFVPPDFRLTERNVDSPCAILDQSAPIRFGRGGVSWTDEGGKFYISKVDRKRVERWLRRRGGS